MRELHITMPDGSVWAAEASAGRLRGALERARYIVKCAATLGEAHPQAQEELCLIDAALADSDGAAAARVIEAAVAFCRIWSRVKWPAKGFGAAGVVLREAVDALAAPTEEGTP